MFMTLYRSHAVFGHTYVQPSNIWHSKHATMFTFENRLTFPAPTGPTMASILLAALHSKLTFCKVACASRFRKKYKLIANNIIWK